MECANWAYKRGVRSRIRGSSWGSSWEVFGLSGHEKCLLLFRDRGLTDSVAVASSFLDVSDRFHHATSGAYRCLCCSRLPSTYYVSRPMVQRKESSKSAQIEVCAQKQKQRTKTRLVVFNILHNCCSEGNLEHAGDIVVTCKLWPVPFLVCNVCTFVNWLQHYLPKSPLWRQAGASGSRFFYICTRGCKPPQQGGMHRSRLVVSSEAVVKRVCRLESHYSEDHAAHESRRSEPELLSGYCTRNTSGCW